MANIIYLDTHVVVWLYAGQIKLLSDKATKRLEDSDLLISPMVALELQYLLETERISENPSKIINSLSLEIGLQICDKNFKNVIHKALDINWTRDPFDRIITAYALLENQILVTKDETILNNYPNALW